MRGCLSSVLYGLFLGTLLPNVSISESWAQGAAATLTVVHEADLEDPAAISGAASRFRRRARSWL